MLFLLLTILLFRSACADVVLIITLVEAKAKATAFENIMI